MAASAVRGIDSLKTHRAEILAEWLKDIVASGATSDTRSGKGELEGAADKFFTLLLQGADRASAEDLGNEHWKPVTQFLESFSSNRARQGFTSSQTATFIFSLKQPVFNVLRREIKDPAALGDAIWDINVLLDKLGLATVSSYQASREAVIVRQHEDMMELSTPVVQLWEGILALPLIGTLDSARTQVVMETLLQRIVETGAEIAILDITGVATVDTLVAQHLLKTVTAIRLMGSDCIVSGLRPQIAQTIVHLGVNLQGITTKATLADALALALDRTGRAIVPRAAGA